MQEPELHRYDDEARERAYEHGFKNGVVAILAVEGLILLGAIVVYLLKWQA